MLVAVASLREQPPYPTNLELDKGPGKVLPRLSGRLQLLRGRRSGEPLPHGRRRGQLPLLAHRPGRRPLVGGQRVQHQPGDQRRRVHEALVRLPGRGDASSVVNVDSPNLLQIILGQGPGKACQGQRW